MIFQRWRISSFIAFRFCLLFICLLVSFSLLIFAVRLPKYRKNCVHWTLFSDRQKWRRGREGQEGEQPQRKWLTTTTTMRAESERRSRRRRRSREAARKRKHGQTTQTPTPPLAHIGGNGRGGDTTISWLHRPEPNRTEPSLLGVNTKWQIKRCLLRNSDNCGYEN